VLGFILPSVWRKPPWIDSSTFGMSCFTSVSDSVYLLRGVEFRVHPPLYRHLELCRKSTPVPQPLFCRLPRRNPAIEGWGFTTLNPKRGAINRIDSSTLGMSCFTSVSDSVYVLRGVGSKVYGEGFRI